VAAPGRLYRDTQMIGDGHNDHLVIGHDDTSIDRDRDRILRQARNVVALSCADCLSHCGCRHLASMGELSRIDAGCMKRRRR